MPEINNQIPDQPDQTTAPSIIKPLNKQVNTNMKISKIYLLIIFLIIFSGIGSGYLLANYTGPSNSLQPGSGQSNKTASAANKKVSNENEAGIKDQDRFPDITQGNLEKNDGSVTSEGTHQLIREGGPSQTVYLTSSVVDLSKFEGKKVEIMGQTFASQTAGWLMDVGYIKVIK